MRRLNEGVKPGCGNLLAAKSEQRPLTVLQTTGQVSVVFKLMLEKTNDIRLVLHVYLIQTWSENCVC